MSDPLAFGPFLLLEKSEREKLGQACVVLKLKQGDTLIEERSVGDDAYLLVDGSVRIVAQGENRTLALVGAPALVGEMAVVQGQGRSATVLADTPCTVLRLPGQELRRLMDQQPLFASAMRERADLLLADAFLKRKSPLRDLPAEIVSQLIAGTDDDLYLVRRGAVERLGDGQRSGPGDFVQRDRGERYAAAGETWLYELRVADVASEIIRHQENVRAIAARLGDGAKVRIKPNVTAVRDRDLGGTLVHDAVHRAVVSEHIAALLPRLDGKHDITTLVRDSGRTRGEVVEGLSMFIAAGLAEIKD